MKKIIFAIAIIFAAISFSSCTIKNDKVELDIKRVVGKDNVCGSIKIKTLDVIDGKFYQYIEEYDRTCKNHNLYHSMWENAVKDLEYWTKKEKYWRSDKWFVYEGKNVYKDAQNNLQHSQGLVDFYKIKADSCYNHIQNLQHTKICGTLYVARYYSHNKFGIKKRVHDYKVFAYNDNGNIHEYNGNDRLEIILSVYPKAGEEYTKQLQNIGALGI